jgi:hypothetical protein
LICLKLDTIIIIIIISRASLVMIITRTAGLSPISLFLAICIFIQGASATGGLNGLPVLNGPINTIAQTPGMKTRVGDFIHPGLWHTHDDLERIRNGVLSGEEPWKSAYANFSVNSYSQANVSSLETPNTLCFQEC